MLIVTTAAFIFFWLSSHWLLQLGPPRATWLRLGTHGGGVVIAAILIARGPAEFAGVFQSRLALEAVFAFHAVAAVVCFGLKRSGRYELAWLVATIPPPALWVLFAETAATLDLGPTEAATTSLVGLVAALWLTSMAICVWRVHGAQMGAEDIDYVVNFAGRVNLFGAGLVVLAISPSAFDSFQRALRALAR